MPSALYPLLLPLSQLVILITSFISTVGAIISYELSHNLVPDVYVTTELLSYNATNLLPYSLHSFQLEVCIIYAYIRHQTRLLVCSFARLLVCSIARLLVHQTLTYRCPLKHQSNSEIIKWNGMERKGAHHVRTNILDMSLHSDCLLYH